MEKRFFLALLLSFLVLGAYSSFMKKTQHVDIEHVTKNYASETAEEQKVRIPAIGETSAQEKQQQINHNTDTNNRLYTLENETLLLKFSATGAILTEAFYKPYNSTLPFKTIGLVAEWANEDFVVSAQSDDSITFSAQIPAAGTITKTYQIDRYGATLVIGIYDVTNLKKISYEIFAGTLDLSSFSDHADQRYLEAAALFKDATILRKTAFGLKKPFDFTGKVVWAGLRDRYFCSIMVPENTIEHCRLINAAVDSRYDLVLSSEHETTSGATIRDTYKIFLGAQDERSLRAFGASAEKIVSFGAFDAISKVLLFFLNASHKIVKNWGAAIIIVTVFVYLLVFPLSMKSMLSIKKMQALQPKVEELRGKLKDNPQKLNIEIMELYKKEKVNPFGGCIPMLLQIPVFFALYQVLMRFISLKGAKFLWIADLSEPDRLFRFQSAVPVLGHDLNLLPLLMAASMFFQQKVSSLSQAGSSAQMAEQQKIMTIAMPIIFCALFYKLPSGLVLYWFVNGLLMLAFQWKISKINPHHGT